MTTSKLNQQVQIMQCKHKKASDSKSSYNKLNTTKAISTIKFRRSFILSALSLVTLFSATSNASAITTSMSSDIANEFKKQFSLQKQANKSTKLALMNNPYQKALSVIDSKLSDEAENGQPRRLMTYDESIIKAKMNRFEACQGSVAIFIGFSKSAYALSTMKYPATKEQIMTDNFASVEYPFTVEDTNDGDTRPLQIALELGWNYRGNGEENVEVFFETCLAIPVSLYYWEDTF
tara:strand:- start:1032 stop:1736 length:705 start_codon:yes stop_codon:yes gene_type:complete